MLTSKIPPGSGLPRFPTYSYSQEVFHDKDQIKIKFLKPFWISCQRGKSHNDHFSCQIELFTPFTLLQSFAQDTRIFTKVSYVICHD